MPTIPITPAQIEAAIVAAFRAHFARQATTQPNRTGDA